MHIALNNGAASFFVYPYGIRYLLAFLRLTFPLNAVNLLFQNRILLQGHRCCSEIEALNHLMVSIKRHSLDPTVRANVGSLSPRDYL